MTLIGSKRMQSLKVLEGHCSSKAHMDSCLREPRGFLVSLGNQARALQLLGLLVLWLGPTELALSRAHAQSAEQKVLRLNTRAMARYTQLQVDEAYEMLEKAARLADSGGVSGQPLARTYMNMATIQIAGYQENAQGLQLCVQALEADPTIEPDPLTSTPEVQGVFELARTRVAEGGTAVEGDVPLGPQQFAGPGNIPHSPAPEQLPWTAVPVAIEVPEDAIVGPIYVFYRGEAMPNFTRSEMQRIPGGYFGLEIPCEVVAPGTMRYYIVAHSTEGEEIGFTGNEQEPVEVPIVETRTQPAPSLPGYEPPVQCKPPKSEGCQPGDENCPDEEETVACEGDLDCEEEQVCDEGRCVAAEDADRGEVPRFIAHIGFGFGGGWASSGMPADRLPESDASLTGPFIGPDESSKCEEGESCVRVTNPGFVPIYALRMDFGYFPWKRIGFSVFMRYQFKNGRKQGGLPPGLALGGRVHYRVTKPSATGFDFVPYVGLSYGDLQLQPAQVGDEEPFIVSGLGGAQLGAHISYRFIKNVGIYGQPELMFQFPTFLFAMELSAGLEVAF